MIVLVFVLVGLSCVAVVLFFVARQARRGGTAGSAIAGAMAAYDEAMHSTAYDEHVETQQAAERTASVDSPEGT